MFDYFRLVVTMQEEVYCTLSHKCDAKYGFVEREETLTAIHELI